MQNVMFPIEPYTFTGSAVLIGLILANSLSPEEQDSVGNWLQLVGLVIQTFASQVTVLSTISEEDKKQDDLETIKKAIQKMKDELDALSKDETGGNQ